MFTYFLFSFVRGLFFGVLAGTIWCYFVSMRYFIQNKKKYNEYTWSSFKYSHYCLIATIVIFFIMKVLKP